METSIIKIGNSQGIIIPKQIISKIGAKKRVNLQLQKEGLLIVPIDDSPRKGWGKAFSKAIKNTTDAENLFDGIDNDFDKEEWTW